MKKILTSNGKPLVKDGKVFLSDGGGEGATITTKGGWQGTVVPNTGYVENVYVNTNLSVEEVNALLDSVTYNIQGVYEYSIFNETASKGITIFNLDVVTGVANSGYMIGGIADTESDVIPILNTSTEELATEMFGVAFTGWYSDFNGIYEFNDTAVSEFAEMLIGTQNNLLSTLFSVTPFEMLPGETISLSGEYNGTAVTVKIENEWQGTPVPNTGIAPALYLNTDMSIEEVIEILSTIDLEPEMPYILASAKDVVDTYDAVIICVLEETTDENGNIIKLIQIQEVIYDGTLENIVAGGVIFDSTEGWYSDMEVNPYPYTDFNLESSFAAEGMELSVGERNDKISSLFSTTPFTLGYQNLIDVESYLSESKLPLQFKLKVDEKSFDPGIPDGYLLPEGTIDITENGTLDVSSYATANVNILNPSIEIPKIEVPNSGYVEKVYFNTNLTKDEVVNILRKLSFISVGSTDAYWALESETTTILITRQYGVYKITVTVGTTDTILFKSDTGGWKTNEVSKLNPLYINETVNSSLSGYSVGAYNSKIAKLLSINLISFEDETPIELSGTYTALYMEISDSGETDIKPFITNKQLPLKIYVEDKLLQLIKATKSCAYLFQNYTETDFNKFIKYEDTSNATSFSHMYKNCTATSFPELNTSNGTDFSGMYLNCANVTTLPTITTTKGTNFSSMYEGCKLLTEVPAMSTNRSVNFSKMFKNCESLTNLPSLSGTSVTDFSSMYEGCKVVTTFPTQYTGYGKIFSNMYKNCTSAITLPELNTSNGTDFSGMYNNCLNATSFPALDTSNGTNFNRMYYNCRAIVNLPELNTSKGTDLSYMYYYCINATNFPSLDTSNCINFNGLYCYCKKATSLPELDTGSGVSFAELYSGCESLTSVPMLDTSRGTTFSDMYSGCSNVVDFPLINTSKGINFTGMYSNCSSAKTLPDIDTSNGIGFNYMFRNCESLTAFPNINTSKGTSFVGMYWGCPQTEFPLIDTSNGTNFKEMYCICRNATSFPAINTSKGTNFMSMYETCTNAISFPPLNTDNGTEFSYMFSKCGKAKLIDISRFSVISSKNAQQTFNGCNSLKALIIRSFGASYYISSYTIRNCYHMLGTVNETYNPNGDKDGYVYVPRNMIETLQGKEYWSQLQYRALEDYTKDGTTTGEFDNEKAGLV